MFQRGNWERSPAWPDLGELDAQMPQLSNQEVEFVNFLNDLQNGAAARYSWLINFHWFDQISRFFSFILSSYINWRFDSRKFDQPTHFFVFYSFKLYIELKILRSACLKIEKSSIAIFVESSEIIHLTPQRQTRKIYVCDRIIQLYSSS